MAVSAANPSIWEEIDRCESYLVCSMFEEAASLSSSVLKQLCVDERVSGFAEIDGELDDMVVSAGMVFVQSLKESGRTSEILKELKQLFSSVTAIPLQVLLAGVCLQLPDGPFDVKETLEEFLSKWKYQDEKYYVIGNEKEAHSEEFSRRFLLGVDKYLEVVELYTVTFLARTMDNTNLAISWVEKASLPEEKKQQILRRLYSVNSSNVTSSSRASADECRTGSAYLEEATQLNGSAEDVEARTSPGGDKITKQTIAKLSRSTAPLFWWFRSITLRLGNHQLVISNGNVFVGCLVLLLYYFMRRRHASLKRIIMKQFSSAKKALTDLWQLAFSYQVNPLAAIQPLPATAHGSR